jgi:hypothetical protein
MSEQKPASDNGLPLAIIFGVLILGALITSGWWTIPAYFIGVVLFCYVLPCAIWKGFVGLLRLYDRTVHGNQR